VEDEETRIFQIWILPTRSGEAPGWGSRAFPRENRDGRFVTLASGMAGDTDALPIRTDARVAGVTIKAGETVPYTLGHGRHAYLVPATGRIRVGDVEALARDGVAIKDVAEIRIEALEDSEILLVDTL
jgi:hypothetical protein